jgi:hypothetical protein
MPAVERPLSDYSARSVESGTEHFWLFSASHEKVSVIHGQVFGGNARAATIRRLRKQRKALAVPSLFSAVLAG